MNNIALNILIIDSEKVGRESLERLIVGINKGFFVQSLYSLHGAEEIISEKKINTIYIDPISLDLNNSEKFIFNIRKAFPHIVFVLYYDFDEQLEIGNVFYAGQRKRFKHYYKLNKGSEESDFSQNVFQSISKCQGYLSLSMDREQIDHLKAELKEIEQEADGSQHPPIISHSLIIELIDQLDKRIQNLKNEVPIYSNAGFLGAPLPETGEANCFIIMPFSQSWSSAVEQVLSEVCSDAGFKFKIAKAMQGRFVPHDIWQGITGATVIIADLTGANPNVSYEVGLADAVGKQVVLICQDTKVPFDFLGQRLIVYEDSVAGALTLKKKLKERLSIIEPGRFY